MPKTPSTNRSRYVGQRNRVTPPHVSIGDLRVATGMTIDQLLDRLFEVTGHRYTRGAISAIENGHRGASADLLEALAVAYGLRTGAVTATYRPRGSSDEEVA